MARLARLWVATRTDLKQDSGTVSPVKLKVFAGGQLKLARTLAPASDKDFADGRAGVFELDMGPADIQTEELDASSFRVDILGDDGWRPDVIVVWAEIDGGLVIPLAISTGAGVTLSTDPTDDQASTGSPAQRSFTLLRISYGKRPAQVFISHHLVIARTNAADDSGTEADIMLEVRYKDALLKGDLRGPIGKSKAAMTFTISPIVPPGSPNPAKNRNTLQSIVLRTKSADKWLPSSFFVFGVRGRPAGAGPPINLIPLVHIPRWNLGGLSTDSKDGRPSMALPLAPIPDFPLDDLIPAPDDESIDPGLA